MIKMDEEICDKDELEGIVCRYLKNNKKLSKDQISKIYNLLQNDIIENMIPDTEYWRTDKRNTFDFSVQLRYISIDTLINILDVAGFNK